MTPIYLLYYATGIFCGIAIGMPLGRLLPQDDGSKIIAVLLCFAIASVCLGLSILKRPNV